jgi:thiol-disulfide isomerase/thioredoxin
MSGRRTFVVLALVPILLALGCQEPVSESESSEPGQQAAPSLVLSKIDGSGTVSLAEKRGKVILVDLWATWCVPCIAELPHLQEMSDSFAEDDFLMLGIVLESGEREEVLEFVAERNVTYTQVMGEENTSEAFGPFLGYPTKYLIDRGGNVVKRYFGIVGKELSEDVQTLIENGVLVDADS